MSSYNAVPPPGAPPPEEPEATAAASSGPLSASDRLAALRSKLSDARSQNHKAVVAEDRRNKLGPEALKKQQREKAYNKAKEAGLVLNEEQKRMATTAEDAEAQHAREEKKEKRRKEYGWDVRADPRAAARSARIARRSTQRARSAPRYESNLRLRPAGVQQ